MSSQSDSQNLSESPKIIICEESFSQSSKSNSEASYPISENSHLVNLQETSTPESRSVRFIPEVVPIIDYVSLVDDLSKSLSVRMEENILRDML